MLINSANDTNATSSQRKLAKGRIAPAHESFSRLQTENVSFKRFKMKRFAHPYSLRRKSTCYFKDDGKRALPVVESSSLGNASRAVSTRYLAA